jgi:hypothetical protein
MAGQEGYPGYDQARGRGAFAAPGRPGAGEDQAKYDQPGQGLEDYPGNIPPGTGEQVSL